MKNLIPGVLPLFLLGILAAGCNRSQESAAPPSAAPSYTETSPAAAPPPPPPPQQPQELSIYVVPKNPATFSMQAIQNFKKRTQESPSDVEALIGMGDANFMISRFDVAKDYYERAVKADGANVEARISLSNCVLFMGQPEEAVKQLDQLLAKAKDNPEALYNKGLILLKSSTDHAAAKEAWTKLVSSHPEHPLAQQVKEELARL